MHHRGMTSLRPVLRSSRVALALLLALSALVAAPQATFAASTINVNTTADENGAGTGCSLREAIASANTNTNVGGCTGSGGGVPFTINVPAGTYNLTVDELILGDATNTNTSIVGAGAASTIIRQTVANRRVFDINPPVSSVVAPNVSVSMSGVTITGGNSPSDNFGGAGIFAGGPGNALTLSNCAVSGNSLPTGVFNVGAGVGYSGGGVLTVNNCQFSNNTAVNLGGAISYSLLNNTGAAGQGGISVTNSTFTNNSSAASASAAGGAIRLTVTTTQTPSAFTISNNTFTGNSAPNGFGGAIVDTGSRDATIRFNRFANNTASQGSGIYKSLGSLGTINATHNWWGCNAGPGNTGCDSIGGLTTSINTAPRLVMSHVPGAGTLLQGNATTLTASFLTDSAGAAVPLANLSRIIGAPIAFSNATRGTLSSAATTVQTNGTATATFTAGTTAADCGAGGATAVFDNQSLPVSITIQCAADLTATLANNVSGSTLAGQSWIWTATIRNTGNGAASFTSGQTVFSANLPNSASISYGTTTSSNAGVTCSINGTKDLICNANTALSLASAASFTVSFSATANATGSYAVPRASGICAVDPNSLIAESSEANNSCSNSVTVNKANTTTTITGDTPDPSVVGQPVTVSYSVTGSGGTPTGNVTVSDGTASCTGTVAAGSCSITFTTAGAKTLTATYAGDTNFNSSTSAGVAHQVNQAGTTTTITSDTPDPSTQGQAVTVNFTVVASAPGAGTPTGNVTVSDGVDSCSGTVAAGSCSITLSTTGNRTLTATYAGDVNFLGSSSAGEAHVVNAALVLNLAIQKSHSGNFTQGQTGAQYTISVSNVGTAAANSTVTVVDTLPAGLSATAISGSGWSCTLATLTCTRSDALAAGSSYPNITLTVDVASNAPASVTNSATVTISGDSSAADNTANDPTTIGAGDTTPPDTTINSQPTDPSNSSSASFAFGGSDSGTGVASFECKLDGGSFTSCTSPQSYTTLADGSHTFQVRAIDGAGNVDATPASYTWTIDTSAPNVTITQASGQADPTSNSLIHFTVVFNEPVTGFANSDVELSGTAGATTVVVSQIAPNDGTTYDVAVSGMTSGGTVIATIAANKATDAAGNGNNASTSNDNIVTYIILAADLTITKSHGGNFTQGQTGAQYSIIVTNGGTGASNGTVTVVDTLPSGLTATAISGSGWSCTLATLTCTRSDALAAGSSYPNITLTVDVASNAPASVTNTATVSGGGDSDTTNNSSDDMTVIEAPTNIDTTTTITTDTPDPSVVGQSVVVAFSVTANQGSTTPSGNVTVSDGTTSCTASVATGQCSVTFTTAGARTLTATYAGNSTFNGSTSTNTAHVVNKADTTTVITSDTPDPSNVGQTVTVQYNVTVNAPGAGTPTGSVTVSDGSASCTASVAAGQCDLTFASAGAKTLTATYAGDDNFNGSTSANETHTVILPVVINLGITKSHSGNFTQGQTGAQYSIAVSNSGTGASNGTVTVVDTLPGGLTATAMSGSGWNCTLATLTCTRSDALAAGSSYPNITLTANVASNAPASVTNTATVSGGGDASATNNTATDPTTIVAVTNTPPTISVAAGGACLADFRGQMNLAVSDAQTAADNLMLSASSSNSSVVPSGNITFGGSGANRTVTIAANSSNSVRNATITITVSDGNASAQTTITVFVGTSNNDTLTGTNGSDLLLGGNGQDKLVGKDSNDLLCGGSGDDTLRGGNGDDTLDAGSGQDTLYGDDGNDQLYGGQGDDTLNGGDNNDTLRGGDGQDKLYGNDGNDQLYGENGDDTMTGGDGADFFSGGPNNDKITDFKANQGDTKDSTIP